MTMRLRHLLTGLAAAPLLVLAGCGSDDPASSADPPATTAAESGSESTGETETSEAAPAEATITIKDFAYGDPLTVAPGTTVTVVNEDSAPHNANDAGGAFMEPLLGQGEMATFMAPAEAGTYDLICTAHEQMSGELIVEG